MNENRLNVWLGNESETPAPKPRLDQVLYSHPNQNGSRKMCMNCVLWMHDLQHCSIHDEDLPIGPHAVCGYHITGKPQLQLLDRKDMQPVQPENSGLKKVEGGIACDLCTYYRPAGPKQGRCHATVDEVNAPASVLPLGVCTLWTEKVG